MTTLLEETIAQIENPTGACFGCGANWTPKPDGGAEIKHEPTCVYLELLALGDTDDDDMDGLYVFAKCLKATLIAIYEEWASLHVVHAMNGWGEFLAGWIYECDFWLSDGTPFGFIRPQLMDHTGMFGNHWAL